MIVITGYGHSGTRVIAEIYERLGFDLGKHNSKFDSIEINKIHDRLLHDIGALRNGELQPSVDFTEVNRVSIGMKKELQHFAFEHEVVKSPSFNHSLPVWLAADTIIDHVIVVHRDVDISVRSQKGDNNLRNYQIYGYGLLLNTLLTYHVPHTFVRFPEDLINSTALVGHLPKINSYKYHQVLDTIRKVFKPEMIKTR